jgi:hypothetical protein
VAQATLFRSIEDVNALKEWHEYQEFYRKIHKTIAPIGEELYIIVKKSGYDTLEKQKSLFRTIIDMYTIDDIKLGDILYIE